MSSSLLRKRVHFSQSDDIHLLREVAALNPYEESSKWSVIQSNILKLIGKSISERTLKERMLKLLVKFEETVKTDMLKSGVEEHFTEEHDLLHTILCLYKEFKAPKIKSQTGKSQTGSSYQRALKQREEVTQTLKDCNENLNYEAVEKVVVTEEGEDLILALGNKENTNIEQEPLWSGPEAKQNSIKTNEVGKVLTPRKFRNRQTGIKQNSLSFLQKKNDRWYEMRNRELTVEEKKIDLETWERKKRIEFEERRLEMEEKRAQMHFDLFKNQQRIIEIALQKKCLCKK